MVYTYALSFYGSKMIWIVQIILVELVMEFAWVKIIKIQRPDQYKMKILVSVGEKTSKLSRFEKLRRT